VGWQRLDRRTIYESAYMKAWEDTVKLPSGQTAEYSVVDFPDGVLVVATDTEGRLILLDEYKYAVDDSVLTFPAGGIDEGETPEQAALRELKEETGYEADGAEIISSLYPFPSKLAHISHVVRVSGAIKAGEPTQGGLEAETLGPVQLVSPDDIQQLIKSGKFNTTYMVSALALAFPDKL